MDRFIQVANLDAFARLVYPGQDVYLYASRTTRQVSSDLPFLDRVYALDLMGDTNKNLGVAWLHWEITQRLTAGGDPLYGRKANLADEIERMRLLVKETLDNTYHVHHATLPVPKGIVNAKGVFECVEWHMDERGASKVRMALQGERRK